MATRKAIPIKTAPVLPAYDRSNLAVRHDVGESRSDDAESNSLAVDDTYVSGGDPYNSTGHFVLLEMRRKKLP